MYYSHVCADSCVNKPTAVSVVYKSIAHAMMYSACYLIMILSEHVIGSYVCYALYLLFIYTLAT